MKQLTINPNNRQYYSEDFIKGFECGTQRQLEADKADRPQGEWIEDARTYYETLNAKGYFVDQHTPYFTDDIACPNCLAKFSTIDNETERFDYCPHCGCRMKGADE